MLGGENQLHWTQRIALVRHNLHSASRSGDFHFFKTLQAAGFMEGTNHVAALSSELGDDADTVIMAMDNLNAGLAYAHQDAFKNVYDSLKKALGSTSENREKEARSKFFVDASMQRAVADLSIDRTISSAVTLITQQPAQAQEAAAHVWITGVTIIADAVEITLQQMEALVNKLDDFIRMEESWNIVKASVVSAITGLKGVFQLMDSSLPPSGRNSTRNSSIASAGANFYRRLSNAFGPSTSVPAGSRSASVVSLNSGTSLSSGGSKASTGGAVAPIYRTPNYVRASVAKTCPTAIPPCGKETWAHHKLATIPPTPAYDDSTDPFDTTNESEIPPVPKIHMPSTPDSAIATGPVDGWLDSSRRNSMSVM